MDRLADIARVLAKLTDPKAVERLLRELLTPSEIKKLSLRWDIVRLLAEGRSQRAIARRLGVSLCKITRGARELKKRGSLLRKVFDSQSAPSAQPATKGKAHAYESISDRG
jgi:TrpR family trp operon transcriptional repressor